jgi:hypothetical protein
MASAFASTSIDRLIGKQRDASAYDGKGNMAAAGNTIPQVDSDAAFKLALTAFRTKLIEHEGGAVEHMYLDNAVPPKVTVGVGNMLPDAASARALPFRVGSSQGVAATQDQIGAEWLKVRQLPQKNYSAKWYRSRTTLVLPIESIFSLFDQRIDEKLKHLRSYLPGFSSYPIPARLALVDMAFNVGASGIVTKFPKLTEAIKRLDWKSAAICCERKIVSKERNAMTRTLLDFAAAVSRVGDGRGVL